MSEFPITVDLVSRFEGHDGPVPCAFEPACSAQAVGLFFAPHGCICKDAKTQTLCAQHAVKAQQNGVDLRIIAWLAPCKEER